MPWSPCPFGPVHVAVDDRAQAAELARTGVVKGMSFGFEVVRDAWTDAQGRAKTPSTGTHRTINEVRLHEVPAVVPAAEGLNSRTSVPLFGKVIESPAAKATAAAFGVRLWLVTGSGRKPRFCGEHQAGKYAKARQRTRDAEPKATRPACCEAAGRRGGRLACEQHKQDPAFWDVGPGALAEDYAAALPASTHTASEDAHKVGAIKQQLHGVRVGMPDDTRLLWFDAMTESCSYGPLAGSPIRVIGQPDLTADWQPSRHPAAKAPVGLIRRGPDWPWAVEAVEVESVAA